MKYFFIKLNAPRANFMETMTDAESDIMRAHAAYLKSLGEKGLVAAYGPVADPKGAFGMGILTLPDDMDPMPLTVHDPVMTANIGFEYELHSMPQLVVAQPIL